MQLKLTWRIEGKPDIDILVCQEQVIRETLHVLAESGYIPIHILNNVKYIKALRAGEQINVFLSYGEANIYTGDIIEVIIE